MQNQIKLVAVDVDGTFVRDDLTYNVQRFKKIFAKMNEMDCNFVVASGNQYYQLRDYFPRYYDELSFVAENGAFVKDHTELIFTANIEKNIVDDVLNFCKHYPEISNVVCGVDSAYCERGSVSQDFFEFISNYYHRLKWVDDLKMVDDQILKFALSVPEDRSDFYYNLLNEKLQGKIQATSSGHGAIDLIVPGCHKASGLEKLVKRWKISPAECVAFGDGGNDVEMLKYCGCSYAMDNAPEYVKSVAKSVCPSNNDDGVLVTLEKIFGMV